MEGLPKDVAIRIAELVEGNICEDSGSEHHPLSDLIRVNKNWRRAGREALAHLSFSCAPDKFRQVSRPFSELLTPFPSLNKLELRLDSSEAVQLLTITHLNEAAALGAKVKELVIGVTGDWEHHELFMAGTGKHSLTLWHGLQTFKVDNLPQLQDIASPGDGSLWPPLQELVLTRCANLKGLPQEPVWGRLTSLHISRSWTIMDLPESMCECLELVSIEINRCPALKGLPQGAGSWTRLRHLSLGVCDKIQELPEGCVNWTNLHTLSLFGCHKIKGIPEGGSILVSLRSLNIVGSGISQCKDRLDQLRMRELTELNVGYFPGLTVQMIPVFTTALRKLRLSRHRAVTFDSQVSALFTSLEILELKHCTSFEFFPTEATSWKKLEVLSMESCIQVRTLPELVGHWTRLTDVDLSHTQSLESVHEGIGKWTGLKRLRLTHALIKNLSSTIGSWVLLEEATISHCKLLQELPLSIGCWRNIKKLDISGCCRLDCLPQSTTHWINLEELESNNCRNMRGLSIHLINVGQWPRLRRVTAIGSTDSRDYSMLWSNLTARGIFVSI